LMGAEYYLFAVFVFALILILIVLLVWGLKKNKSKDKEEVEKKEQKVMMLYFEVEDMINGLKEYVDASREKTAMDIRRIEMDMQMLSTAKESLVNTHGKPHIELVKPEDKPDGEAERQNEGQISLFNLHDEGHDVENIAKIMNKSKTEVELMIKMQAYNSSEKKDNGSGKKS